MAFGETREKKLTKPKLGHLKKAGVGMLKHLAEFRGEPGELEVGAELKVDSVFEKGQIVKVSGKSKGKGFAGTIKRHNFASGPKSHGSHNVRAPGSIGASADPARVFKGIRGPGQMGNKRATQQRPRGRGHPRQPAARARLRAGRQGLRGRDQERGLGMAASAKYIGKGTGTLALDDAVFAESFHGPLVHEAVRAELAARRRGTASTQTRGEVSMTGAKAWRQKGTGRARVGALSSPTRTGGGVAFGPKPRALHGQGEPQGTPARAARGAVRARRARLDRRGGSLRLRHALDQGRRGGARLARRRRPRARGAHRRRGELREVLPQHHAT